MRSTGRAGRKRGVSCVDEHRDPGPSVSKSRRRSGCRNGPRCTGESARMIPTNTQIWLVAGVTDMRRGFTSLSGLVQSALDKSPLSGQVFIFRGRRGDLIKLIWHDGDGMCLFQKRLDRGRFVWPQATSGTVSLTRAQLSMLCEGIDWREPEFARLSEGQNPQTAEQL